MHKFLVTGGAGFVGSNLALTLEAQGHQVVVVDHSFAAAASNLKEFKGGRRQIDVSQPFDLEHDFSAIFHQAALTDPRYSNDAEILEKNVNGFQFLLTHCLKHQTPLIYASTAGLYGNGPVPMREDQPKHILTAYGKSKLVMDEMAAKHFNDIRLVGLRYFNVFGPRESHKGRPASMIYHLRQPLKEGKPARLFKFGEQVRDFVYVKDIVRANLCALTAPSGIYNVGTGVGTSFNKVIRVMNLALGTDSAIEYFEMPFAAETYQGNTVADTEFAREKLGFVAEWEFEAGVRDYMGWLDGST